MSVVSIGVRAPVPVGQSQSRPGMERKPSASFTRWSVRLGDGHKTIALTKRFEPPTNSKETSPKTWGLLLSGLLQFFLGPRNEIGE